MEHYYLQAEIDKLLEESLTPLDYEKKLKELQTELFIKIKRAREDYYIKLKKLNNTYFNY